MAKLTKEQRNLLEQKLDYVKNREKEGGKAKRPIYHEIVTEIERILKKEPQPNRTKRKVG